MTYYTTLLQNPERRLDLLIAEATGSDEPVTFAQMVHFQNEEMQNDLSESQLIEYWIDLRVVDPVSTAAASSDQPPQVSFMVGTSEGEHTEETLEAEPPLSNIPVTLAPEM